MEDKAWYKSKTVWAGLIIATVGILKALGIDVPLVKVDLPEEGRLSYVENLLREGAVDLMQACVIIADNSLLENEMREIAEDSKKEIYNRYGIEIRDYR